MSITITDNDVGSVVHKLESAQDDTLNLSSGKTIKAGTILARDSVSLKLVPFVKGGSSNENGIPKAVLAYELEGSSGDNSVRVVTGAVVDKNRLVIDADGDDANVDDAVLDQLRDYGISAIDVNQLGREDNPQETVDS